MSTGNSLTKTFKEEARGALTGKHFPAKSAAEIESEEKEARNAGTKAEEARVKTDIEHSRKDELPRNGRHFRAGAVTNATRLEIKKKEEDEKEIKRIGKESLKALEKIYEELADIRAEIDKIESQYLSEEERAYLPGETWEEHKKRIEKLLQEKGMTQEELDHWRAKKREEYSKMLEAQKHAPEEHKGLLDKYRKKTQTIKIELAQLEKADIDLVDILVLQDTVERDRQFQDFLKEYPEVKKYAEDKNNDGKYTVDEFDAGALKGDQIDLMAEQEKSQKELDAAEVTAQEIGFQEESEPEPSQDSEKNELYSKAVGMFAEESSPSINEAGSIPIKTTTQDQYAGPGSG